MMKDLLIVNGNIIVDGNVRKGNILIKDGIIVDANYKGDTHSDCEVVDAKDMYVSPGFIDLHVHGGGGYDFMDCTVEAFENISKTHLKNGATTIVPTAVSSEFESLIELIRTYKKAIDLCPNFHGIHLECP